ncbi:MAG: gamma-glutamylcyclotransferase family protein [Bacteroidota bacterium]
MESDCKYLFVYGSLLDGHNEFGVYLKNNSRAIAQSSFPGLLYDMGEYPGAIHKPQITGRVYGQIVQLNDATILKALDEYEGFGDNEEQPNLFIRVMIPIATKSGTIGCWVYLYNLPIAGYPQILSGRYK